jgi:hypothetical protein
MNTKRKIFGLIPLLCLTVFLQATEISEGGIKLVLHDKIGRFSLYYKSDPAANSYIPLFLDQDPRTSLLTVFYKGKTFRMGDSSNFTLSIEKKSETGAAFYWKSPDFEVTQSFNLIKSLEAQQADSVSITIQIKNLGGAEVPVGAKFLIDTYLGEESRTHFSTPEKSRIQTETSLRPSPRENYFLSTDPSKNNGVGFQAALMGKGITTVDEVIFANWKRLNETYWLYTVNPSRNFNMLPYSINDSAVCLYYKDEPLGNGETREITLVFGNMNSGKFEIAATKDVDPALTSLLIHATETVTPKASNNEESIKADLLTVKDLIRQLNSRLASPQPVTQDELNVLRRIIEELSRRKSRYE